MTGQSGKRKLDDRRGGQGQEDVSPSSAVSEDRYVEAVDELFAAADRLCMSLDCLIRRLAISRRERLSGVSMLDIIGLPVDDGGRDARRAPKAAFTDFERALAACRAIVIRALVDDEDMDFTSVGRLIGVSRQMVARLYQAGAPPRRV
jgi:hypothetical protein